MTTATAINTCTKLTDFVRSYDNLTAARYLADVSARRIDPDSGAEMFARAVKAATLASFPACCRSAFVKKAPGLRAYLNVVTLNFSSSWTPTDGVIMESFRFRSVPFSSRTREPQGCSGPGRATTRTSPSLQPSPSLPFHWRCWILSGCTDPLFHTLDRRADGGVLCWGDWNRPERGGLPTACFRSPRISGTCGPTARPRACGAHGF